MKKKFDIEIKKCKLKKNSKQKTNFKIYKKIYS